MSDYIKEIIDKIDTITKSKVSKEDLNNAINELKTATEKREKELDDKFKTLDEQREQYIEKITGEFKTTLESVKNLGENNKNNINTEIYGKNLGEFIKKVKENDLKLKTLSENVGADGGFLIPPQYSSEIQKWNLEASLFRNNGARVIAAKSNEFILPAITYNSNADGSQFGGVTAYWVKEAGTLTASQPTIKNVTLKVNKLIGYTESTEELNEDIAIPLSTLLSQLFGEVLAFKEDIAFLSGDGIEKPLGILNSPSRVTVSRQTASSVGVLDVIKMISRFRGNLSKAVWVVNQTALPYLYQLTDLNGNFIWMPGMSGTIANGTMGTLYGIPIRISEKASAIGTEGDIGLYDLSNYIILDKDGIRIEETMDFKFSTDVKCWKMVKRLDGKPWMNAAITPYAGSETLSPFVTLV